jgi:hypothetical protein
MHVIKTNVLRKLAHNSKSTLKGLKKHKKPIEKLMSDVAHKTFVVSEICSSYGKREKN